MNKRRLWLQSLVGLAMDCWIIASITSINGVVRVCEVTGVSRPAVGRAIKVLKDDSWVDAVKIGNATAYCVNAIAFWQAGRNQKKYAICSATVIASESE